MKKIVRNELNSSQIHQLINRLGIGANVVIADESNPELYKLAVLRDLESNQIPEVIEAIETNVQEVKGIIGKDTAELYNLIKRLASAGTYRAATLQLQACNAAMEQENQTVTYFWELGRYFEALERTILLDQDFSEISVQFKACVNDLPQNTRWRELIRLTNQLIKSKNFDDYLLLSEEFNALLQQGV